MHTVMLRVSSPSLDVKTLLGRFPQLTPDALWQRGEPKRPRGVEETSGLSLLLAEASSGSSAVFETRKTLEALSLVLEELRRQSASCVVDFGLLVGGEAQFTGSVHLLPEDLAWFAERGLGLCVSAYPTSG